MMVEVIETVTKSVFCWQCSCFSTQLFESENRKSIVLGPVPFGKSMPESNSLSRLPTMSLIMCQQPWLTATVAQWLLKGHTASLPPTHQYTHTHTHTQDAGHIGHRRCQDLGCGSRSRDCYVALVYDDDVSCWTPGLGFQSPCCACFYRPCLAVVDECRCCCCRCCWPLLKSALLVGVMSA